MHISKWHWRTTCTVKKHTTEICGSNSPVAIIYIKARSTLQFLKFSEVLFTNISYCLIKSTFNNNTIFCIIVNLCLNSYKKFNSRNGILWVNYRAIQTLIAHQLLRTFVQRNDWCHCFLSLALMFISFSIQNRVKRFISRLHYLYQLYNH